MLHPAILNEDQVSLLPLIRQFGKEFYLVGGTAIALYLGHRRSIDFDLFKYAPLKRKRNLDTVQASGFPCQVTYSAVDQMNLIVSGVKLTFFQYPFRIRPVTSFEGMIRMPSLLDLAAMKAYALGRRSKWKDYVDLYFLLQEVCSLEEISSRAGEIFGGLFSDKLFRAQLAYFEDIDYSEEVDYLVPHPPTREAVQDFCVRQATAIL